MKSSPPPLAVRIRDEEERDWPAVRRVHTAAFETPEEADLVDALRPVASPLVSLVAELVAELDGAIAGHVLFSPVSLEGHPSLPMMGLGPMAVAPRLQRRGIGSALVREGLARCRALGAAAVVVVGHPGYYPRFGFTPASGLGLACEFEFPDEAWMALELEPGALDGLEGTVKYHPAFGTGDDP